MNDQGEKEVYIVLFIFPLFVWHLENLSLVNVLFFKFSSSLNMLKVIYSKEMCICHLSRPKWKERTTEYMLFLSKLLNKQTSFLVEDIY